MSRQSRRLENKRQALVALAIFVAIVGGALALWLGAVIWSGR